MSSVSVGLCAPSVTMGLSDLDVKVGVSNNDPSISLDAVSVSLSMLTWFDSSWSPFLLSTGGRLCGKVKSWCCARRCLRRLLGWAYVLPQFGQGNALLPKLCTARCFLRSELFGKRRVHPSTGQGKGFSPGKVKAQLSHINYYYGKC